MKQTLLHTTIVFAVCFSASMCLGDAGTQLKVFPPEIRLRGQGDRQTIAVQLVNDQGITRDVSATVVVKVKDVTIAEFDGGTLKPKTDGETRLLVELGQQKVEVPVIVKDLIGLPPTREEYDRFVSDTSADKRAKLVDNLLAREEFIDRWSMKWGELLRIRAVNNQPQYGRDAKAMWQYAAWVLFNSTEFAFNH